MQITKDMVPASVLKSYYGYGGGKFEVEVKREISLQGTYWSGGSRSSYRLLSLSGSGEYMYPSDSPFEKRGVEGSSVFLEPGQVVVEHSIFCGKDMGLTIYMLQEDFDKLGYKAPETLDPEIKRKLYPFVCVKSGEYRKQELRDRKVTDKDIEELVQLGYLKRAKNGALTATMEAKNLVRA